MRDKIVVITTALVAMMMIGMAIAPSFAFIYAPPTAPDTLFEYTGPHIDKILVKKYGGTTPMWQALQNGEIDITDWALDATWKATFTGDANVILNDYGGEVGYYTFNFNCNDNATLGDSGEPNPMGIHNPTADVDLRRAFSYLVDRSTLSSGPGQGLYTPIYTPIPAYMQPSPQWVHPDISYTGSLSNLAYPPSIANAASALQGGGFPLVPAENGGYRFNDWNGNGHYDGAAEDLNIIIYARQDILRKGAADYLTAGLNDPAIKVHFTRYDVAGGDAWQHVMVEKNYNMYTSGWTYIGPDPDFLYDLYHMNNYWHPTDPPNFGAVGNKDSVLQGYLEQIKFGPAETAGDLIAAVWSAQERFADMAYEIPLASTASPKAYSRVYTGGNDALIIGGDPEDQYRGLQWTQLVNLKGVGHNNWWTTQSIYPGDKLYGDGNMVLRYGWKDNTMPQTLNPMYSSWYWESEVYGRIYDSLGSRNPYTLGPMEIPQLASNWTYGTWHSIADGKDYSKVTLKIRPDIKWSDGVPFTIDDVTYTFVDMPKELAAKGAPDAWWQPTLDRIASFYKVDPYTVEILANVKNFLFLNWVIGNIIVPKHIWKPYIATHTPAEISGDFAGDPAQLVGTGPFKLFSNEAPAGTLVMVKNNLYYQIPGVAPIEEDAQGSLFTAIAPSIQLSANRINATAASTTGKASLYIDVHMSNMFTKLPIDFDKTVTLICYNGTVVTLAATHNVALGPSGIHHEAFGPITVGQGQHTVRIVYVIKSGDAYDWIHANLPPSEWAKYLGPFTVEESFWNNIPSDINADNIVDIFDIVIVAASYGKQPGDPGFDFRADLNHDGIADIFDIVLVAGKYNWTPNGV